MYLLGAGLRPRRILTAYYFGGSYELTDGVAKKYYSFGGQTMMRDANGLQYFITDHLGSTVAVTDASGTLTSQQRYLPFGGVRTNVTTPNSQFPITDLGYTGQRALDPGMGGLMDYKFRMYSPGLGRFISPDTITPGGPQGLDRYSYVSNSPVNFNDPTGHMQDNDDDGGCNPCTKLKPPISDPEDDDQDTESGGNPDDYVGSIPDAIINQLVSQGADLDFLKSVTIHNLQDEEWKKFCGSGGAAARTWESTIYFCDPTYYDPNKPNGTLLHELIHVAQFQKYPEETMEEIQRIGNMKARDKKIEWWNTHWTGELFGKISWTPFNPYRDSWVELQGNNCGAVFKQDPSIPLDRPPCNLAPFE